MSDSNTLSSDAAQKALQAATHGLLFPSESDRPIKPVLYKIAAKPPYDASYIDALKRIYKIEAPPATVESLTIDALFAPLTTDQSWFGPEEKAMAQRFRELAALLNQLTDAKAFRVTQADPREPVAVYVLGYTSDGDIAGVSTELVET